MNAGTSACAAHESSPQLLALHGLRLKGIAEPDVVAATMGADAAGMAAELESLQGDGLASYRYGRISGYLLTPAGRATGEELLANELDATGTRSVIEGAYADFLTFNHQLLEVCTSWQLREGDGAARPNDHGRDHDEADTDRAVRERLVVLHRRIEPVVATLAGALRRFAGHGTRLTTALERVLDGDDDYFTKPMFPSYHSVWFELHEDLLATLGTERRNEGAP